MLCLVQTRFEPFLENSLIVYVSFYFLSLGAIFHKLCRQHSAQHSAEDAECSNKTTGTVSRMPWQWFSMWCIFSLSLLTYKLNWLHTIQWAWMGSTNCWACVIAFGLCLFTLAWLGFSSLTFIQPELAHISEEKQQRAWPWK